MKGFIGAASLLLILASANALGKQPGDFNAARSNHGGMMIPCPDNPAEGGPHRTIGDKSELLGTPYYHQSTN
ncbi:multiple antibiotic resistance regulatory periplasmic protein MarB [Buttiauxella warmboldiae]|uniref:Multiple antibiotic resistance regulatory periplasmic protein MarB n=1 Tax=Buttiauxella warmboldiae TaxID=82993 RepID=A0A3N5D904_9ENTR|nr:multiple antibiotic resistance regulatory protein MarB [Buttiauxella warmboldiae]RPH24778.1 multiple antibiotic resistance regulatory periplasmic protein MarB [Buttiauxella warmboldiae]